MIRPATPSEAGAIRDLVRRAYAPWVAVIGRRPAPMDDDYERHVAAGEAFVLLLDGAIAAVAVLIDRPDHLLLDNIAVDPARRSQGLGRRMIAFAEAEGCRRGVPELRLFTHARMLSNFELYIRLGFQEVYRAKVDGFDRVFMSKPLRAP